MIWQTTKISGKSELWGFVKFCISMCAYHEQKALHFWLVWNAKLRRKSRLTLLPTVGLIWTTQKVAFQAGPRLPLFAVSRSLWWSSRSKHCKYLNSISFRFCLLIVRTETIKTECITAGLSQDVKIYLLTVQGQIYFLKLSTEKHTGSGAVLKKE